MLLAGLVALWLQDFDRLIRDLDSDDPETRERAAAALVEADEKAAEPCKEALKHVTDAELRERLQSIVLTADPWSGSQLLSRWEGGSQFPDNAVFSPDLRSVAYTLYFNPGFIHVVTIGNRRSREFANVRDPILWSPDGKACVYVANRGGAWTEGGGTSTSLVGGKWHVVVGDVESEGYKDVGKTLAFSPDGKTLAYSAVIGEKTVGIVGKNVIDGYDHVEDIAFSPDGSEIAFRANRGGKRDPHFGFVGGRSFIVAHGKEGAPYDLVWPPKFSQDGKTVGYFAMKGRQEYIVIGDKEAPIERSHGYWFKPDMSGFAYKTREDGKLRLVMGNWKSPPFVGIGSVGFSPDGARFAFVGERDQSHACVVLDGTAGEDYQSVSSPVFTPDGKTVGYVGYQNDKTYLVINGLPQETDDYSWKAPAFTPDGKHLTYAVVKLDGSLYRSRLRIGKWRSEEYEHVWPAQFSPDGKKAAFGAHKNGEYWRIVADVE